MFLDLEGVRLGRHGFVSIISLLVNPQNTVYLIDLVSLGGTAFSCPNGCATSLKAILESSAIPKVVFDVRDDSNALFSECQISVAGIEDLKLMQLACRRGPKTFVAGLAECINEDITISAVQKSEWRRGKENVTRLIDPGKRGRYEVFSERPLHPDILQYCAKDVELFPKLYSQYDTKLRLPGEKFWRVQVQKATAEWIKHSQDLGYDGQAKDKVRGPWTEGRIEQDIEGWNDTVMSDAMFDDERVNWSDLWDNDDDISDQDTARDCDGWEEDMIKNGDPF